VEIPSATVSFEGGIQKIIFCRGESKRKFFQGGNPELAYFAGGKHHLTLFFIQMRAYD